MHQLYFIIYGILSQFTLMNKMGVTTKQNHFLVTLLKANLGRKLRWKVKEATSDFSF